MQICDHDNDLGPFGRFEKATGFGDILVGAANGVGAAIEFSTAFSVAHGRVYNVWLDVQNETIEAGDIYSIHIQEEGQEGRVTLFENYVSDRNPAGQVDLGLPFPNLDHLLLAAIGTEQGAETVLIDDIYISLGAFLDTIPVAASPFKFSEPSSFGLDGMDSTPVPHS